MSTQPNPNLRKSVAAFAPAQRIVIQGVRGAFHEIAARTFFGAGVEVVPALSFAELFDKTARPEVADAAVLAIENSIAGSILGNYKLLQDSDLQIIGEVYLPIRQNLMALPGTAVSDLKEVHSHPMALAQCQPFFQKHPHIRLVESEDTALSAERIAKQGLQKIGAIAASLAAEVYGLEIIAPGIEANKQNFTRFLAVQPRKAASEIVEAEKTSVSFTAPHRPGSLARILAMLAAQAANLTKIQSVPILGKPWEYLFFLDFTVPNPQILPETLRLLDVLTHDLTIFGKYKSASLSND